MQDLREHKGTAQHAIFWSRLRMLANCRLMVAPSLFWAHSARLICQASSRWHTRLSQNPRPSLKRQLSNWSLQLLQGKEQEQSSLGLELTAYPQVPLYLPTLLSVTVMIYVQVLFMSEMVSHFLQMLGWELTVHPDYFARFICPMYLKNLCLLFFISLTRFNSICALSVLIAHTDSTPIFFLDHLSHLSLP